MQQNQNSIEGWDKVFILLTFPSLLYIAISLRKHFKNITKISQNVQHSYFERIASSLYWRHLAFFTVYSKKIKNKMKQNNLFVFEGFNKMILRLRRKLRRNCSDGSKPDVKLLSKVQYFQLFDTMLRRTFHSTMWRCYEQHWL